MAVIDKYGRTFKTLRISLINTCNLACLYCVEDENQNKENRLAHAEKALDLNELMNLVEILHQKLDISTIRLTGGEPLLYQDLVKLIKQIKLRTDIEDIKMTTNGFLLEKSAAELKEAGLTHINISLDAINKEVFYNISRRKKIEPILKGIEAAQKLGFNIKLNAVIMKRVNDSEVLPLFEYAKKLGITIRFLELMNMGHLYNEQNQNFFGQKEILDIISQKYKFKDLKRRANATSNEWITDDGYRFGIIANESKPFCSDCDRLRLDVFGNIYGCLSSNLPIQLINNETAESLEEKLNLALSHKQALKFTGSKISMLSIGG